MRARLYDFAMRWLAPALAQVLGLGGRSLQRVGFERPALALLYRASRFGAAGATTRAIARSRLATLDGQLALLRSFESFEMATKRAIVLRLPRIGAERVEKGVLVLTFTHVFSYFLHESDLTLLGRHFHVVLEPSWSGYADPQILAWAHLGEPVFVMASELRDRALIDSLGSGLVSLSIGASDWVDDRIFTPLAGVEKRYDAVYVTNHALTKRTHAFLAAVRSAWTHDPGYRAAVVFASWGGRREEGAALVARHGLEGAVEIHHELSAEELNRVLNQSKASVLLSLKEGSNRSLFESMFAGTPVVLLSENVGVQKAYVNEFTGLLADEACLPAVLLSLRERSDRFAPREWAEQNISAERSTAKLAAVLARHGGAPLRAEDLAVKVNRPEAEYKHRPARDKLEVNAALLPALRKGSTAADLERACRALRARYDWL